MSVDIEDWFQVGAFETVIDKDDWPRLESRVQRNTDAVLDLFGRAGVKATFFTLGWVAEQAPQQMRRIVAEGHEIASHGWDHDRVFTMSPDQFRADLRRAKAAIEDAAGAAVTGYRAPELLDRYAHALAHPILAEEGYVYSSSVAPVKHDHYGWPDSPRFVWKPVEGSRDARTAGNYRQARRSGRWRRVAAASSIVALPFQPLGRSGRSTARRGNRPSSTSIRGRSIPVSRAWRARRSSRGCAITAVFPRWRAS